MSAFPHYDVITVSDLRLPGGTAASIAEELTAQHAAGLRSGLIQVDSRLVARQRPLNPKVRTRLEAGMAEIVTGRAPVTADLLILRHPAVITDIDPSTLPDVRASSVVLVANQSPGTPTGAITHYDPLAASDAVERWLGIRPQWRPIGPLVRQNLELIAPGLYVGDDWVNIIDLTEWQDQRPRKRIDAPVVIGRHSRDHRDKWPDDTATLRAAYPLGPDIAVEILGGANVACDVLGGSLPNNWTVHRFGSMTPQNFLARLDFLVYFHHPDWVEAFGRTVLEALAAGVIPILPEAFRPLFGSAAVYCAPDGVRTTIEALSRDPEELARLRQAGRELVLDRFSHQAHLDRIAPHVNRTVATAPPPSLEVRSDQPRVLFVSSNGAGVGHLMRLMSMARRATSVEPVFLTLSQAIDVVHQQGFPVEYLPSRQYLGGAAGPWHDMLRTRLCQLIDRLDIHAVVFDGTWPYQGLLDLAELRPEVHLVWSRRAMWKDGITSPGLDEIDRFSLIIEPGEFAASADRGITSRLRHQVSAVEPITFLDSDDQVEAGHARQEMGLEPGRPAALVQLGAGNIDDTSSLLGLVVSELLDNGVQVCVTRSAIAAADPADLPKDVHHISVYPLSRYLAAFDLAVAASGYNTFHELVGAAVPTVFVPNLATATDDQLARARYAEEQGVGRCLTDQGADAVRDTLSFLFDQSSRAVMRERAVAQRRVNGAAQAIAAIEQLLTPKAEPTAGHSAVHPRVASGSGATPTPALRAAETAAAPKLNAAGVAKRLRALRTHAAKLTTGRTVRRLTGVPFRLLPTGLQRQIRRRLRRWSKAPTPALSRRLSVPSGAITADEDESLLRLLIWLDEGLDDDAVAALVDGIAGLQVTYRGFVPLFITRSRRTATFRSHNYAFEYLPDPRTWPGDGAGYRQHIDDRIADIVDRFAPAHLARVTSLDDVARFVRPLVLTDQ